MNEMQEAARRLHALGFKTIPIKPGTKEPACAHGVKDATADDAATDAWYGKHPDHGIGVSGDGFVIFDFDVKDGVDGRDELYGWKLPDTLCQTTPSGGYHMIYRTSDEVRPSVNAELAVDVRGWHSYIVCDPTPGYTWESDCEIADADEAVMAFLEHVRPSKGDAPAAPKRKPKEKAVSEGGRNDYLFRMGRSLRADETKSDDEIVAYLHGLNRVNCKPPLSDAEVEKLAASVLSVPPGYSEEVQRSRTPKHVKIAQELVAKRSACYLDGVPAVYDGTCYRMGWDAIEKGVLEVDRNAKSRERKEVCDYLKLVMPARRSAPPNYIAFRNGVLDVDTMELAPFSPDLLIPNVIPHDWVPGAYSAVLDATLAKIACGNPYIESNLCEFIGLSMYRSAKYGYSAILLGRQGGNASNGKSTYIKLIADVLGADNYSALDINTIGQRFQAAFLAGMLANLGDDISSEFVHGNDLALFKKVVTGQEIYTDVKGRAGFKFRPYCTTIFSANTFPRLGADDEGVMRRLFPIRFNAVFSPQDADYDPDIGEKLAEEPCLEAAIVRGVAGLKRVMEARRPTPNTMSERMVNEIRVDNSSLLQWMEDAEISRADMVGWATAAAYESYTRWCEQSGIRNKFGKPAFGREIVEKLDLRSGVEKRNGKSVRVYQEP